MMKQYVKNIYQLQACLQMQRIICFILLLAYKKAYAEAEILSNEALPPGKLKAMFITKNSPWEEGVEQNLVYANSNVLSSRKARIWIGNEQLRTGKTPFTDIKAVFSFKGTHLGSYMYEGDDTLLDSVEAELEEDFSSKYVLYQAGIKTGKDVLTGQMHQISNGNKIGSPGSADIFNFSYFDFNMIMPDGKYTNSDADLKSWQGVEQWLNKVHHSNVKSSLANWGVGAITSTAEIIPIDGFDSSLPATGAIRIENEEMDYERLDGEYIFEYPGFQTGEKLKVQGPAIRVTRINGVEHGGMNENTDVERKVDLSEKIDPTSTTVKVSSTAGAISNTIKIDGEIISCLKRDAQSFSNCTRQKNMRTGHAANAPVYFKVGKLGALASRIIYNECTNIVVNDKTFTYKPNTNSITINPALILTHIQKESQLHSLPANTKLLGIALGVKFGNNKWDPTFLLDQLIRGIQVTKNTFNSAKADFIQKIYKAKKDKEINIYYVEPNVTVKNKMPVKFKIHNRATHALFTYTPHITAKTTCATQFSNCIDFGGVSSFVQLWRQYGFDKSQ